MGNIIGGHLAYRHRRQRFGLGLTVYGLALVGFGVLPVTKVVSGYLLGNGVDGIIDPIYAAELNEKAPEKYRATILSLPGTGFSLGMIILFPLAGWLMAHGQWVSVYGTIGLALFLMGTMVLLGNRRKTSQNTHPMSTK
ncbi:Major Facilitator Superfamily protein [Sulfobacillus thermosulfidooxidans DSM 9293]|uniref:Major Facilitator Superfamily protein n=1 Tax=Sulfobacillus thermosulfidooxidans (strain DSM 9293 / VKM B-1269 / AT-1) TaxID=929705 RepID=A0A1W1WBD1_SULTA|nr:MFS transporter [Sulfobacillus thermosulfidooxidans]SMC03479.1 Major Facilitator Superfamily protein [Sulfobacillus thermosulfidooxidans DSM 9293]